MTEKIANPCHPSRMTGKTIASVHDGNDALKSLGSYGVMTLTMTDKTVFAIGRYGPEVSTWEIKTI